MVSGEPDRIKALFRELISSNMQEFPEPRRPIAAPKRQGVYVIYSPSGKCVHVGTTYRGKNGLKQRLQNHLSGNSSFTIQFLGHVGSELRNGYQYQHLVLDDPRTRVLLEAYAIGQLCPAHIGLNQKRP